MPAVLIPVLTFFIKLFADRSWGLAIVGFFLATYAGYLTGLLAIAILIDNTAPEAVNQVLGLLLPSSFPMQVSFAASAYTLSITYKAAVKSIELMK